MKQISILDQQDQRLKDNILSIVNPPQYEKIKSPLRYPGGKFYALKILKPFWEFVSHDEYREPFVGGGSVFFAKPKVEYNWINDKHEELMITYKVLANPYLRIKLLALLRNETATPERHSQIREFIPKNDIEIAYKYFYLNRTSFSGKMRTPSWGYRPKRSIPPERWPERLIPCGNKLENVKLTNLDFEKVITEPKKGKNVFLFIDPPYYSSRQESHYSCSFKESDHIRLAKCLSKTEHKFFMTYDDSPEIRKLYKWAYIYPIEFYYRLDNSQHNGGSRNKGFELVITNYPMKKEIQSTLVQKDEVLTRTSKSIDVRSPFRFPGSKLQAIKFIKPLWEKIKHEEYREPFVGGGAVFFAKPKVDSNWINDIDRELITTLKVINNDKLRELLIKKLTVESATKERFLEVKELIPKDDSDIAFRYFYLNRTSYSGIMNKPAWGYDPKKSVHPNKWGEKIEIASNKLKNVKITCLDFEEIIIAPSNKNVFLFIDPPYYLADQKRAYKHSFTQSDHTRLARLLRKTDYPFCLTYDNCEQVKELYQWAKIHPVSWRYHTANSNKANRKLGNELIITNF